MTPSARIQAIIDVFEEVDAANQPMDNVIGDYMRGRRYIGSKDRAYIMSFIYDMARAHAKVVWWVKHLEMKNDARNRVLVGLTIFNGYELNKVETLFDGDRYGAPQMAEKERKFVAKMVGKDIIHKDMTEDVVCECPPEHEQVLREAFGEDFKAEMMAMLQPANLDLRVNVNLKDREEVIEVLAKDDVDVVKTLHSSWGLRTKHKVHITQTKAFKKGWIDIQDQGSQLVAYVCDAKPGMQVLDYCAGGGGKTLALAAGMQVKGRLVAMDIDERRLKKAKPRIKRAHVSDIVELRAMSDEKNRKWLRRQKQKFDVTLLDVPCSGTGTWRRNPDLRWGNFGPSMDELLELQVQILDRVAHTVKPGGRLVYATCSILPQENEHQVTAFLERHPEYKLCPLKDAWPDDEETTCPSDTDMMRLTPYRNATDGFFAAVLVRQETAEDRARAAEEAAKKDFVAEAEVAETAEVAEVAEEPVTEEKA